VISVMGVAPGWVISVDACFYSVYVILSYGSKYDTEISDDN